VVSKQTKSGLDKILILFIKTLIKNESKYPLFQYTTPGRKVTGKAAPVNVKKAYMGSRCR
jgi:hypothetical protein